jgi:hypothetical protein
MKLRFNSQSLTMFEGPWLRRQVQSHLIFGPLSQHVAFGWIMLFVCTAVLVKSLWGAFSLINLAQSINILFFVGISLFLLRLPKYHQAAIGWCAIKITLGILSFCMLLAGGLIGFFRGQPDAIHLTLLALIWFPGPEFIPKFIDRQKYITISRIFLTIPVAYFGYQTGNWYCK